MSNWKASNRVRRRGNESYSTTSSTPSSSYYTSDNDSKMVCSTTPSIIENDNASSSYFDNSTITSTLPSLSLLEGETIGGRQIVISTASESQCSHTVESSNNNLQLHRVTKQGIIPSSSPSYNRNGGNLSSSSKDRKIRHLLSNSIPEEEEYPQSHNNNNKHYKSSITYKIISKFQNCYNNNLQCLIHNIIIPIRTKLYDTKDIKSKRRLWNMLQCAWFSLLLVTIMVMLRISNQLNVVNTKNMNELRRSRYNRQQQGGRIGIGHNKKIASPPRFYSHVGHMIPDAYHLLSDVNIDNNVAPKPKDIPFFWHIPRSGGATMTQILSECLKLTLASDAGARHNGHENDSTIKVLTLGKNNAKFVNVDTSSIEGINHAKKLRLSSSNIPNMIIISTRLYEVSSNIFTTENKGRMFTFLRHPIQRAASLFYYTQDTNWRRHHVKQFENINILEYFKSGLGENNWMTRFLSNTFKRDLTNDDLDIAKEVLRRKCLIGLLSQKADSFDRMQQYFHIQSRATTTTTSSDATTRTGISKVAVGDNNNESMDCIDKKLNWAWPSKHKHDVVEEGSELWDFIMKNNVYDMELYNYAIVLFKEQAELFQKSL